MQQPVRAKRKDSDTSNKITFRFEDTNTGEIFGEVELDKEADFTITTLEHLPERNPLHERALTLDDLYMGQEVWLIDVSSRHNQVPATIISKPFRRPHEPIWQVDAGE